MAGLDKLKKASNEMPFTPKKINIGEPTSNPIAETKKDEVKNEPVTIEKAPTPVTTKIEKPKNKTKDSMNPIDEKKDKKTTASVKSTKIEVVDTNANFKKSKNEGTTPFTAKFLDSTDREFFNSFCVIKNMDKWEYLQYLINNNINEEYDRNDELHTLVKDTKPSKLINATTPVTPEDKEKMLTQAAMHGFRTPGAYVAYLVRKERLNTPGWN